MQCCYRDDSCTVRASGNEGGGVTLSATPPGRIVLTITPVVFPPTMPKPRPVPSLTSSMVSMCCHCFTRARDSGGQCERERVRERGGERDNEPEGERAEWALPLQSV